MAAMDKGRFDRKCVVEVSAVLSFTLRLALWSADPAATWVLIMAVAGCRNRAFFVLSFSVINLRHGIYSAARASLSDQLPIPFIVAISDDQAAALSRGIFLFWNRLAPRVVRVDRCDHQL